MASIKGIWIFNNTLTGLEDSSHGFMYNINYSTYITVDGVRRKALCSIISSYMFGSAFSYVCKSTDPADNGTIINPEDGFVSILAYDNDTGWNIEAYGEEIKILDFGSESQPISDSIYAFITSNAVQMPTIKGCYQWKAASEISYPSGAWNTTEVVNFRIPLLSIFNATKLFINYSPDGTGLSITADIGNDVPLSVCNESAWNILYSTRVINFGDSDQYVSPEFYNFITSNASAVDWSDYIRVISGKWKYNDVISTIPSGVDTILISTSSITNLSFIANGILFDTTDFISQNNVISIGLRNTATDNTCNWIYRSNATDNGGWLDRSYDVDDLVNIRVSDIYQTWDFGATDQEVTIEFYDWLIAEATKLTALKGCWLWNERLSIPSSDGITQKINFISGFADGIQCSQISIDKDESLQVRYIASDNESIIIYDDGYWNTKYFSRDIYQRIFDFGNTEQIVSQEFHDYIIANATETSWNDYFSQISGMWRFNDTIALPNVDAISITSRSMMKSAGGDICSLRISNSHEYGLLGLITTSNDVTKVAYVSVAGWLNGSITLDYIPSGTQGLGNAVPIKSDIYQICNFGIEERWVNNDFYGYLLANASDITGASALVEYNGNIIGAIQPDKFGILNCKNEVMGDDLVIRTIPIELLNKSKGVLEVTENGTYDVRSYNSVIVKTPVYEPYEGEMNSGDIIDDDNKSESEPELVPQVTYVVSEPVEVTLTADAWNGSRYSLSIDGYNVGSFGLQIGIPSNSSVINTQEMIKSALTVSTYSSTSANPDKGTAARADAVIAAVNTPSTDLTIWLFGLEVA